MVTTRYRLERCVLRPFLKDRTVRVFFSNGDRKIDSLARASLIMTLKLNNSKTALASLGASLMVKTPGPDFMALLTVNKELMLMEAGNSVLTSSMFHKLAGNVCL